MMMMMCSWSVWLSSWILLAGHSSQADFTKPCLSADITTSAAPGHSQHRSSAAGTSSCLAIITVKDLYYFFPAFFIFQTTLSKAKYACEKIQQETLY